LENFLVLESIHYQINIFENNMPTYEYQCSACGEAFEKFQSMSEAALTDCPLCQAEGQVKRLISGGAGLIFKGSGFYITDYRSEGYKAAQKKDQPASAEPKKSGDTAAPASTTASGSSSAGASSSSGGASSTASSGNSASGAK
jgi:putative FmdB family regulatory protein